MRQLLLRLQPIDWQQRVFLGFLAALAVIAGLAAATRAPWLLALLAAGPLLALVLRRWQALYYGVFMLLPFSRELSLPGGLSMDVPTEPLLLILLGIVPLALLLGPGGLGQLTRHEWRSPLLLLPLVALVWAALGIGWSVDAVKSFKYVLAKCWYLGPFLLGSLLVLRRPADFWRLAVCYVGATVLVLLLVLGRHALTGFAFGQVRYVIQPFFRNHVTYATVLALLLPLAGGLAARAPTASRARRVWLVAGALLLLGLITSYTRASWLSLPVAGLYYAVLRLRQTRLLLVGVALGAAGVATYFVSQDNFMRYTPDYAHTIWHGANLQAHLESTYKFQDVSGMERVYRWVAAARMAADRPLTGSGPSTFYPEYKRYTVTSFRTYVSANPEHSTAHNYFLLQFAEQGLPGLLLWCALVAAALLTAERLYHAAAARPDVRRVVLVVALSLVIIVFHLFLNELVEVDKIGSVFYVALAVLIRAESWLGEGPAVSAPLRPLGREADGVGLPA